MPENELSTPQFPATRWSVVLTASGRGTEARAALEELCRVYWFPLYAFARQRGCGPEDAEDEVQDFLTQVAARDFLAGAAPDRGRLRTYLLAAFQHDLIDAHRRTHRLKRVSASMASRVTNCVCPPRFWRWARRWASMRSC